MLRSSWVATGLGMSLGLLIGFLVGTATIDLIVPLWPWLRFVALLLVTIPAGWAFVVGVVRPSFRRLAAPRVARTIEEHIPGIHNRLVSCVDLATKAERDEATVSPAFFRRLVSEAIERIRGFRPSQVVDFSSLRRAALFSTSAIAAFLIAYGVVPDRLPTALARIFQPFADIPPVTDVVYRVLPLKSFNPEPTATARRTQQNAVIKSTGSNEGSGKALRGEDIVLGVEVIKGDAKDLRIEIRGSNSKTPIWHNLHHDDKRWTFTLAGFEHSFDYRIHGGGTWSKLQHVELLDRPRLVELHTVLHYPPYMGVTEPRVGPPQTGDVTGPEESTVEVIVQAAGDVAEGEIEILRLQTSQVAVEDRSEKIWFSDTVPDGAKQDGTWEWDFRLLGRNAHTDPAAEGIHGHLFHGATNTLPVQATEHLFAYVWVSPEQKPTSIMLQFHDGQSWEHRAFWGEDKIPVGIADSVSKRRMGDIPAAGEWVRLEVPAAAVDLEGKTIRGVAFTLFGGKCIWHRVGTMPRSHIATEELVPDKSLPFAKMIRTGDDQWTGKFPIAGNGFYRVTLRNEIGYANKPMKEAKFIAIPDNPPQVVLERPGSDLTLSQPIKVPLVIAAYDDFGLDELILSIQRGDTGGFEGKTIKTYTQTTRTDTVISAIDLAAMDLKPGDHIRYRVEARDKKKQSKTTQEYVIRIQDVANAEDKLLANLDKSEDTFQEKLAKLIADQAKVKETVHKLEEKYAPLTKKIEEAQAKVDAEAKAKAKDSAKPNDPTQPPPPAPTIKPADLDPEAAKMLAELRAELAEVAKQEQANVQASQQLEKELEKTVEQSKQVKSLPQQLADQLQALPQQFQQTATQPLQQLAGQIQEGATSQKPPPSLPQMAEAADKVQRDLQSLETKMQALREASKTMRDDLAEALKQLEKEMLRERAERGEQELADLKNFLDALRQQLKQLEGQQGELMEATEKVPDVMLADVEKRQDNLETEANPKLAQAKKLLTAEDIKKLRKKMKNPKFPDSPYDPETGEYLVPPKEADTPDPDDALAKADKSKSDTKPDALAEKKPEDMKPDAEDEPLFQPALGGPKPKLDPRFADKQRKVPKKPKPTGDKSDKPEEREELASRQQQKLNELQEANESLAADEMTLDKLLEQLQAATDPKQALQNMQDQKDQPQKPDADSPAEPELDANQLAELLQSPAMREAMAMSQRLQQLKAQAKNPQPNQQANAQQKSPPTTPLPATQHQPGPTSPGSLEAALDGLDLESRTIILKMQPRMREDLLQGLREEGPDGYQKFVRNYYKRLAKVKAEK
ncbi:MAG: hypothetical protein HZA46_23860 [Planctomycetales bacterium]|nr:hypothetical protein [Planctomycetales bacterium]